VGREPEARPATRGREHLPARLALTLARLVGDLLASRGPELVQEIRRRWPHSTRGVTLKRRMEIREARLDGCRPRSAMLLPTEEVLKLCAAGPRREAAFELVFDSEVLVLIHESSLALEAPNSGGAAFVDHTRDVVWLGFEPWKGPVKYTGLEEASCENGAVEKATSPGLWRW
jgi:hypothetical protein